MMQIQYVVNRQERDSFIVMLIAGIVISNTFVIRKGILRGQERISSKRSKANLSGNESQENLSTT
jgi:hypothetical protein